MQWDYPRNLSSKIDTIEVIYVAWACDCANWLPVPRENQNEDVQSEDCIFITPSPDSLDIPQSFWGDEFDYSNRKLRLIGSYYNTKGIPKDYDMNTEVKPDKAKVFRYTKVEVVKR